MHKENSILYDRLDWKYGLTTEYNDYGCKLPKVQKPILHPFIEIRADRLTIKEKYAWDGPSGPTVDTKNTLRASLVHDALYQAIKLKMLPTSFRKQADKEFLRILKQDGMFFLRRWGWYLSVRYFAGRYIKDD